MNTLNDRRYTEHVFLFGYNTQIDRYGIACAGPNEASQSLCAVRAKAFALGALACEGRGRQAMNAAWQCCDHTSSKTKKASTASTTANCFVFKLAATYSTHRLSAYGDFVVTQFVHVTGLPCL